MTLKVKELIAQLQQLDQEMLVYKSSDDEGNSYQGVRGADGDAHIDNSELSAYKIDSVYYTQDLEEMAEDGYDPPETTQVVVIF